MNEGIYTRDKGRSKAKKEPDYTAKKKSHAGKLKNETSQAEAMRKKLRTGKVDISESAEAIKKRKKLQKQGRKKIYSDAAVSRTIHSQVDKANEDNNAGGDAVNSVTELAEDLGYAAKMKELKSSDKGGYSEKIHGRTETKNVKPGSKEVQKNLMKKEIQRNAFKAQAKETANASYSITKRFTDKAEDMAGRIAEMIKEFAEEHPLGLIIALIVLIVVLVMSGTLTSCSMMAGGTNNMLVGTSYTADDSDILAAEADYKELEADLQDQIDNIEDDYPDYDEYNYDLAEIGHNPFELAALLTVLYEDYTEEEAQEILETIFEAQYELEIEEVVETRTRTVTDDEGNESEEEYDYYILNVKLTNEGIRAALDEVGLTVDQIRRYEVIVEMKGNKPDIFGDDPYVGGFSPGEYDDYAVPGEYLTDAQFANMLREAERYLGYPYVWGGSKPSTSFDCSGFVSWVINHCGNGWDYGRLTANGWKNATARVHEGDVKPGDLIFFQGTYDTAGASHVGIVVDPVNKIMIHCGNPIQYASYDTRYWRAHFYCYGRIR
ncbi:Cell wall-associated hydrolase, NlpC family [Butyrivibrio hungatei DSM 14810]|uniref:Cell wall-associated hydrolase, NlpC family n=1 Tax=Butyrivibrio hungatei DSM 14810 TaxID=1121132 RepID=A0A1M7RQ85_9FIRM|nr:C40 family peptidase [Butyrivibrio hungatei]SHN48455.1 Cell wall-associated hydrolase, NlpC family [Butyrivibrio hungatei DSM 14810]